MRTDAFAITMYILVACGVAAACYGLWWTFNFKYVYSDVMSEPGKVVEKYYHPAYTEVYYDSIDKMTKTRYHSAVYKTYISGEKTGEDYFSSRSFYSSVELHDKITINYKERYKVRRDNPYNKEFSKYIIESVVTKSGRTIKL